MSFSTTSGGEGNVPGQWVSGERIVGPCRHIEIPSEKETVWLYRHRWLVEPVSPRYVAGDGVVARDLVEVLEMFPERNWQSALRGQGREIPQCDGEQLVQMLNERTAVNSAVADFRTPAPRRLSGRRTARTAPPGLRYTILKRDGFHCVKCGRTPARDPNVQLHVDHIVAWSRGGETTEDNLQTLCADCNLGKSDRDD